MSLYRETGKMIRIIRKYVKYVSLFSGSGTLVFKPHTHNFKKYYTYQYVLYVDTYVYIKGIT